MKKIVICGDSFASTDLEYGNYSWHEQLQVLLMDEFEIVNLSFVSSSNLLISLQVDEAIRQQPDFIITLFTAVTRDEVCIGYKNKENKLLNRFYNLTKEKKYNVNCDLISYTVCNIEVTHLLNEGQKKILRQYNKEFFDLDLAIYRDNCIIEHTLQKLDDSGIPFMFDQGGFENPKFGTVKKYFDRFNKNKSDLNLWSYTEVRHYRPYFHITDPVIHQQIANYYLKFIKK